MTTWNKYGKKLVAIFSALKCVLHPFSLIFFKCNSSFSSSFFLLLLPSLLLPPPSSHEWSLLDLEWNSASYYKTLQFTLFTLLPYFSNTAFAVFVSVFSWLFTVESLNAILSTLVITFGASRGLQSKDWCSRLHEADLLHWCAFLFFSFSSAKIHTLGKFTAWK